MPAEVEKCVQSLLANKDFKPKKGRTREQSAWAICTAQYNDRKQLEKKSKKS